MYDCLVEKVKNRLLDRYRNNGENIATAYRSMTGITRINSVVLKNPAQCLRHIKIVVIFS